MNASYGGSRGASGQMTLGGMKNNNGPGNDLYIINPSSPKNIPNPLYNHNSYATSPRTPASTAAAMGGLSGNAGLLVQDGLTFNSNGAQMAAAEPRQRSNDSRQS